MRRASLLLISLAVLVGVLSTDGATNPIPEPEDNHYKIYDVVPPITITGPVGIRDQWGDFFTDVLVLEEFSTPVQKNNEGILLPDLHQTWWLIDNPQPGRVVEIFNQFGRQDLFVKDGRYLVVPASKWVPTPLPAHNHYECYDAQGPRVDIPVVLQDQFGEVTTLATYPVLFCNPAEKEVAGAVFPIEDPFTHLTCYELDPRHPLGTTVLAFDQFGTWEFELVEDKWLCVPTTKLQFVPNEQKAWGNIKDLYRE